MRDIGLTNNNGVAIRDHYAISCNFKLCFKLNNKKTISYGNFRSINVDNLCSDITSTPPLNDLTGSVDELTVQYISGNGNMTL